MQIPVIKTCLNHKENLLLLQGSCNHCRDPDVFKTGTSLHAPCTGCNSIFRKIFEFKIWKDPMLVQKQMIHQQKALDLSFNLTY